MQYKYCVFLYCIEVIGNNEKTHIKSSCFQVTRGSIFSSTSPRCCKTLQLDNAKGKAAILP